MKKILTKKNYRKVTLFKFCSRKSCRATKQQQPLTNFYVRDKKNGIDRLCSECKECSKKDGIKRNKKNAKRNIKKDVFNGAPKTCSGPCGKIKVKTKENYSPHRSTLDGLRYVCKECSSFLSINNINIQINKIFIRAKEKNITICTREEIFKEMLMPCYYCRDIDHVEHWDKYDSRYGKFNGLDRIDNSKAYIGKNIVSCCWKHNNLKASVSIELSKSIIDLAQHRGLS